MNDGAIRLPDAIAALAALNQPMNQPMNQTVNAEEANLIRLINERQPLVQRQWLGLMRGRLEAETLTAAEREELLAMAEAIEVQDAARARAIFLR